MTEGKARRFLTAPQPEGDDEDTEDFAAFDIGHACGKARRLAHDRPCAGTFKTVAGGRNIYPFRHRRRFPEGSGIRFGGGAGVQAWRRGKAFGVSLGNSLESDFNWAVIRGPGSGLQKGETPRSGKVPEEGIRLGIRNRAEACGGGVTAAWGGCLRKIGRTWRQGRNEKRLARRQSSPGGNGAWRISRTASALGSGTGMLFA